MKVPQNYDFISEIFGVTNDYLRYEEDFFPEEGKVDVRPSDRIALWGDVIKDRMLYDIFFDFIRKGKDSSQFVIDEINKFVDTGANLILLIFGTTGVGKSVVSRKIARTIALIKQCNIILIRNIDEYLSGNKKSYVKVILNKKFTKFVKCYITYSFQETLKIVTFMEEGDLCIQDEIEKEMGTDSTLIRYMINNITDVAARINKLSFIFNTPKYLNIKNLHFSINLFGRSYNKKGVELTPTNMITYAIINDKNNIPFGVISIHVWETQKEFQFYLEESKKRKTEIQNSRGGKTVTPDKKGLKENIILLFKVCLKNDFETKTALESEFRYVPEFDGIQSGKKRDIINLSWDAFLKFKKNKPLPDFIQEFINKLQGVEKPKKEKPEKEEEKEAEEKIPELKFDSSRNLTKEQFIYYLESGTLLFNDKFVKIEPKTNLSNLTYGDINPYINAFGDIGKKPVEKQFFIEWFEKHQKGKKEKESQELLDIINSKKEKKTTESNAQVKSDRILKKIEPKTGEMLVEYIQRCILQDYSEYYSLLWKYIVIDGMIFSMVAEALKKEGKLSLKEGNHESLSHMSIGNDFKKVRVGKKVKNSDELVGMGYYSEDWYAMQNNTNGYEYKPPHNEHGPDYIHKDGTVDSIKSFWEYKNKYFIPEEDCKPEIIYCQEHKIKEFRLVCINFKYTMDKFLFKNISLDDIKESVIIKPTDFDEKS